MSAPAKVITHGTGPVLADWRFRTSINGPDELEFTAQNCSSITQYELGASVSGYSSMRIVDTTPRLVAGSQFDITCRARGLISGQSRIISKKKSTDALGWDTLQERRMELTTSTVPQFGASHPDHPYMFFLGEGQEETLDLGDGTSYWVQRERLYRGSAAGAFKLIHRNIKTNESIQSHDSITVNLPGGWATPHNGSVSIPRVVVEDTVITTVPPPTGSIPGNFAPQAAPSVRVFPISDDIDPTYNWPNGWKLNAISSDELFRGAGIYLQTLTYEYVWLKTL